jgi:hypothetical protein
MMDAKLTDGRATIADNLKKLQDVYRKKPDPFMYWLQLLLDAKSDELISIFSESFTEEKTRTVRILQEVDPANKNKYEQITAQK